MKKILFALVTLLMITLMCTVALAEGELPTEPFTWEYLATIAGASLATLLIVQLLKLPIDKVWKIPTRIIAYVIALILMTLATHFNGGIGWSSFGLAAVNAVIVALTAMGAYEITFKKLEQNQKAASGG